MCLYSVCWACTPHPGSVFGSGSCEVPEGESLHIVWAGENLEEAEILHEVAEVTSYLALTVPGAIRSRGREGR